MVLSILLSLGFNYNFGECDGSSGTVIIIDGLTNFALFFVVAYYCVFSCCAYGEYCYRSSKSFVVIKVLNLLRQFRCEKSKDLRWALVEVVLRHP